MSTTRDQAQRTLEAADRVCSAAAVAEAVSRMAREITVALADSFPLVLCVMRGAVIFSGQLLPQLRFPLEFDYLDLTRYRNTTRGSEVQWRVKSGTAVAGRTVLVLDDILDEGHTLAEVRKALLNAGASRVLYAVLVEKDIGRAKPVRADFVGVHVPDRYVFGCGMDVGGVWRNLPDIYAVKQN